MNAEVSALRTMLARVPEGTPRPQMPLFDTKREVSGRAARLERELLAQLGRASRDFSMLEAGDRVMVAISGGKDSYVLLHLLRQLQRRVPFPFHFVAVNLDQGHPGFPVDTLRDWLVAEGYPHHIEFADTYSIVTDKIPEGKTYCPLCSRLRRGILYRLADELGCNKIALGHHRDDLAETVLLNLFYAGQLKGMAPRLLADNGRHVVIRPLAYCGEDEIAQLSRWLQFPILPCDLCGSQDNLHRQRIKALITSLHAENPKVRGNMLAAMGNVRVSHLLDRSLVDRLSADDPDAMRLRSQSWGPPGANTRAGLAAASESSAASSGSPSVAPSAPSAPPVEFVPLRHGGRVVIG